MGTYICEQFACSAAARDMIICEHVHNFLRPLRCSYQQPPWTWSTRGVLIVVTERTGRVDTFSTQMRYWEMEPRTGSLRFGLSVVGKLMSVLNEEILWDEIFTQMFWVIRNLSCKSFFYDPYKLWQLQRFWKKTLMWSLLPDWYELYTPATFRIKFIYRTCWGLKYHRMNQRSFHQ